MQELRIEAKNENLHEVFGFLFSALEKYPIDQKDLRQVKLCVEEIFENISCYAYAAEIGETRIAVECRDASNPLQVIIRFSDHGKPFDPLSHDMPDLDVPLMDRPIGGLGIHLVRSRMDVISYEYRDGENILTMQKNIPV